MLVAALLAASMVRLAAAQCAFAGGEACRVLGSPSHSILRKRRDCRRDDPRDTFEAVLNGEVCEVDYFRIGANDAFALNMKVCCGGPNKGAASQEVKESSS